MIGIKTSKIPVVWLLMVLVIGFGQATKPIISPLADWTEHEIFLAGKAPKVGEVFEVVYRVRLKPDVPPRPKHKYYVKFSTGTYNPIEVITANEISIPYLIPGEWHEFRGRFRIPEPYGVIRLNARIRGEGGQYGLVGTHFGLRLIDSVVGQYGTKEQWLNRGIGVLGKYNNVEPQWLSEIDPAWAESNRKIAEAMRKFEPALTDSEALCLHQDNYLLIINAVGDSKATDEERIEYLLKAGWLDAQRSGAEAKENWFNEFMDKNRGRWGGNSNLNFFHPNNNSNSRGANPPSDRTNKDFYGQWWFKDHNYNKDQGLLEIAVNKPVKNRAGRLFLCSENS